MIAFLVSLGLLGAGALAALAWGRRCPRWWGPSFLGMAGAAALADAGRVLAGTPALSGDWFWPMPLGNFRIGLDPLSAWFVLAIATVAVTSGIHAAGYMEEQRERKNLGFFWFNLLVLTGSMLTVVAARNGILFLLAWEVMALSSFFLVMFEHEKAETRRAGWIYLVATHIGTAFVLGVFAKLGRGLDALDFESFRVSGSEAGIVFIMAILGFGTKAGFMLLHVWLPEAHPAAPSPVSALLSGVMIKTGIYGILRTLAFLGAPAEWWGVLLIAVGAFSGVPGVLFALAQHDIKRLLAYHSVENIGIITLGIGTGLLGYSAGNRSMALFGFSGALLHVLNHALFKSLLFLGAGNVVHAARTRDIEHLGGLARSMPWTAATFLAGSAAISGLPPFNGFVSEFLIYTAAVLGILHAKSALVLGASLAVVLSLALIGGLAAACFAKAYGIVFLGEARSSHAADVHEAPPSMIVPMVLLALACLGIGIGGIHLLPSLAQAIALLSPVDARTAAEFSSAFLYTFLWKIPLGAAGILVFTLLLVALRRVLLRGREVRTAVTWDCGYAAPTPRMQYTASSFADPVLRMFAPVMGTRREFEPPSGTFPASAHFSSHTPDSPQERIWKPLFERAEHLMQRIRMIQHGLLHIYILCIVLALLVLLFWKL